MNSLYCHFDISPESTVNEIVSHEEGMNHVEKNPVLSTSIIYMGKYS
jgi:hypothetical protein